jgi:hypothetical protein
MRRRMAHDGFDHDPLTLNHILGTTLGKPSAKPFAAHELDCGGA